ncbi:hypothetical protein GIB67_034984, partial [Kingdonia uniflora]
MFVSISDRTETSRILNGCMVHLCQIELIDSISNPQRNSLFEQLCCRFQSQVELSLSIRDRTETSII